MGETNLMNDRIGEVAAQFQTKGRTVEYAPYGNGHINDTFLVVCETQEGKRRRYILQRMNHSIFKMPQQLMENVVNVTEYLREIIAKRGGNPDRETLN
ncbi:MAG: mucin desulfatase, partial [Lachnospiraceae bacterium]|nr:mucin desulfatase [Lachnospiraceae bacterium]